MFCRIFLRGDSVKLEKKQIQRYMRHIIMPEISTPGQKKLLGSSVLVCCDSISSSAVMLYYLAAMGIGKISCNAENTDGLEIISQNALGLNPDLELRIADIPDDKKLDYAASYDAIIILCEKALPSLKINAVDIPIVFSAAAGDCGYIRTIRQKEKVTQVIDEINCFFMNNKYSEHLSLFGKAYLGFICTLAAIEAVKVLLNIGSINEQSLQFNLATYDFVHGQISSKKADYAIDIESAIKRLDKAKVLIVGSGGLGSPNAYMLAISGIGRLGLIDYDTVEISNLNRQILHSTETVGMTKVKSAEIFLKRLNTNVEISTYEQKFSLENAEALVADYDLVIEGLDNLPNRYLLNDICYFLKKPLMEAGVLRFDGLATTILPGKSPCYRCIFPEVKDNNPALPCSEIGILGAVPGVMGMLQTIEAIKYLTGIGVPLVNKMIIFDALNTDFTLLDIDRAPNCALCGANPAIAAPRNYEFACSDK